MAWVDLRGHPVPPPCHRHGYHPEDQVGQGPFQPHFEHLQGWDNNNFSGKPAPVIHYPSIVKKFLLMFNLNLI